MMGRIRTIKPEFFKHEELFDAEIETGLPLRVAFAGLWTVCDREGRFEWRPRALKTDILPYDDVDFSRVLHALATRGFVVMYRVDGKDYGYAPGFLRHQIVNNRESRSKIPGPPENHQDIDVSDKSTREPRVSHASATRHDPAQGEREGEREREREVVDDSSLRSESTTTARGAENTPPASEHDPGAVAVDDLTVRRDQVLSIMGLDGVIRPDGKITGMTNDQAEIPKWDAMGLTRSEQDAKIREMLDRQRAKQPGFFPSTWRWFSSGLADLAEAKKSQPDKRATGGDSAEDRRRQRDIIMGRRRS